MNNMNNKKKVKQKHSKQTTAAEVDTKQEVNNQDSERDEKKRTD